VPIFLKPIYVIIDPIEPIDVIIKDPILGRVTPVEKVPPTTGELTPHPGSNDGTTGTVTASGPRNGTSGDVPLSDGLTGPVTRAVVSRANSLDVQANLAAIGPADAFIPAIVAPTGNQALPAMPSPATGHNGALVPPSGVHTPWSPPARFEDPDNQTATPFDPLTDGGSTPADQRAVQASNAEDDSLATVSRAAATGARDPSDLDPLDPQPRTEEGTT
jgi:hypothetical protein